MKQLTIAVLGFVCVPALAQFSAATPEQLADFKARTEAQCVADAIQEGIEGDEARTGCACLTNFVWQAMPANEMQIAHEHFQRGAKIDALKVQSAYIRKAAKECKSLLRP